MGRPTALALVLLLLLLPAIPQSLRLVEVGRSTKDEVASGTTVNFTATYTFMRNETVAVGWFKLIEPSESETEIVAYSKWDLLRSSAIFSAKAECTCRQAVSDTEKVTETQTLTLTAMEPDIGYYQFQAALLQWGENNDHRRRINAADRLTFRDRCEDRIASLARVPGLEDSKPWQSRVATPDASGKIQLATLLQVLPAKQSMAGNVILPDHTLYLSCNRPVGQWRSNMTWHYKDLRDCRNASRVCDWHFVAETEADKTSPFPSSSVAVLKPTPAAWRCCAELGLTKSCAFGLFIAADALFESLGGFVSLSLLPYYVARASVMMRSVPEKSSIYEGGGLTITCYAPKDLYFDILLAKNGIDFYADDLTEIETENEPEQSMQFERDVDAEGTLVKRSYLPNGVLVQVLSGNASERLHGGHYMCYGRLRSYIANQEPKLTLDYDELRVTVQDGTPAHISSESAQRKTIRLAEDTMYEAMLTCPAFGIPTPSIDWLFNGAGNFTNNTAAEYYVYPDGKTLKISHATSAAAAGTYSCVARNPKGTASLEFFVSYEPPSVRSLVAVKVLLGLLAVASLTCFLFVALYYRARKSEAEQFFKMVDDFEKIKLDGDSIEGCFALDKQLIYRTRSHELEADKFTEVAAAELKEAGVEPLSHNEIFSQVHVYKYRKPARQQAVSSDGLQLQERPSADSKCLVAVKSVSGMAANSSYRSLIEEIKLWSTFQLHHENLVEFVGAVTVNLRKRDLCAVFTLCTGGSLYRFLRKNPLHLDDQSLTRKAMEFCRDAARGIGYLHDEQILHRDIAARNVLIDADGNGIVCDLGLAKRLTNGYNYIEPDKAFFLPVPIQLMSPESLRNRTFTRASDVWSFGVLIWEVFSRAPRPYTNLEKLSTEHLLRFLDAGDRLTVKEQPECFREVVELMNSCFAAKECDRPNMARCAQILHDVLTRL